jgi:hypothetical protein
MLAPIVLAALAGAVAPAQAIAGSETAVPRISEFLEWRADGNRGLYIRADTGQWYYARTDAPCARLSTALSLRFAGTVQNQLDRYSQVVAEGWRCTVASVVLSQEPPSGGRRVPRQLQADVGQNRFQADLAPPTYGAR